MTTARGMYRVEFDRISGNHTVPSLKVYAAHADELAEKVWRYAHPRCLSRDVTVSVDLDTMTGRVHSGFQTAGRFTIARLGERDEGDDVDG